MKDLSRETALRRAATNTPAEPGPFVRKDGTVPKFTFAIPRMGGGMGAAGQSEALTIEEMELTSWPRREGPALRAWMEAAEAGAEFYGSATSYYCCQ